MFDRTKFINSLDLIAVIVGTYVLGDTKYLSNEFPLLFPPPPPNDVDDIINNNIMRRTMRRHVPTLVLHGRAPKEKTKPATGDDGVTSKEGDKINVTTTGSNELDESTPVRTKRDRKDLSSSSSSNTNSRTKRQRPQFTFEGRPLKLTETPERIRSKRCANKRSRMDGTKSHMKRDNNNADDLMEDNVDISLPTAVNSNNEKVSPSREGARLGIPISVSPSESSNAAVASVRQSRQHVATESKAGDVLSRVLGRQMPSTTMRPIVYNDDGPSSSQEATPQDDLKLGVTKVSADEGPVSKRDSATPAFNFAGEVYFTLVRPRRRRQLSSFGAGGTRDLPPPAEDSDDDDIDNDPAATSTVRGVHHPKFFLLFERSGSLVVIVSTSNLTPQTALEGSWVQRFEHVEMAPRPNNLNDVGGFGVVDFGMPSDFGVVLTDFLEMQSEAAAVDGGMLPDDFLRKYVPCLSNLGLAGLANQYHFDEAQVHLVSTVPGEYTSTIPRRHVSYRPRVAYGPQRVSFILSRILNEHHCRAAATIRASATGRSVGGRMEADVPWLPPTLVSAMDRLVIQPTSLGGNWTRDDLELVVRSYLQPHWDFPKVGGMLEKVPLLLMDIVWPSMDYFDTMIKLRRTIRRKNPNLSNVIAKQSTDVKENREFGESHVFLSSVSFAKLDRSCISRMALFTHLPNVMPYKSASIHIKSVCRLLRLKGVDSVAACRRVKSDENKASIESREYLSWFLLTSSCLSRGAQGSPTPHRDPASDQMTYTNFELGILFCSRAVGDNKHDRQYVSDPNRITGCQCGQVNKWVTGNRWYKPHLILQAGEVNSFLECVKKVHLPVPYLLRPMPYQIDPESDFMRHTPYMHEIPDGTGCVGNMKLTPLGQQIARDAEKERRSMDGY